MIQELTLLKTGPIGVLGSFFEFIRSFFGWWYGDVPITLFAILKRTTTVINDLTSFTLILKGFFRPWKNDYNIAGWLVGIVIKLVYIPVILTFFFLTFLIFMVILLLQLAILPTIIGLIILNPFLNP